MKFSGLLLFIGLLLISNKTNAQVANMSDEIKKWSQKSYDFYGKSGSRFVKEGAQQLSFSIDDDKVVRRVKINGDTFFSDTYFHDQYKSIPFVRHYKRTKKKLYITADKIYVYEGDGKGITIVGILNGKPKDLEKVSEEIRSHYLAADEKSYEYKSKENSAASANSTTVGKKVTEIRIERKSGVTSYWKASKGFKDQGIGFVAVLSDGSEVKTSNIGGKGSLKEYKLDLSKLEVNPNNDKAIIEVSLKKDPSVKQRFELKFVYDYEMYLDYKGEDNNNHRTSKGASGGAGGDANDLKIEVKTATHSVTGEKIDVYKINRNGSIKYVKLMQGGALTIDCSGGNGANGATGEDKQSGELGEPMAGGNGGRGGNAGNITMTVDSSVKTGPYVTTVQNGGKGGKAGSPGVCYSCKYGANGKWGKKGAAGSKGTFTKRKGAVSF